MGILPLKKRVNRDKCSFVTKQRMFGVFAIDEPRSLARALYVTLLATEVLQFFRHLRILAPLSFNKCYQMQTIVRSKIGSSMGKTMDMTVR